MNPEKMRYLLMLFLCLVLYQVVSAQTARERSVEVSAIVQESPPQISFSWTADPNANFYNVYKKTLDAQSWGDPIAVLEGGATSFVDTEVTVGEAFEYAFFKKEFDLIRDTFCIAPGTPLKFRLDDMYGIGLCCNFNFGFYRLEACGEVIAEGSDFDWSQEEFFTACDDGQACTEVVLTIAPDIFPNSTSWVLSNSQTNETIATSGPVGTFIDERPKYGFITAGIRAPATACLIKQRHS